jgi:predicted metal-binding protein
MTHTLFVCTACASRRDGQKLEESGGQRLLNSISQLHQDWPLHDHFQVQPVKCMGVCHRECTIALSCAGKFSYIFGDLRVDETNLESTATAILHYARQYHDRQDGAVAFGDRDPLFKNGSVARIPPIAVPV